MFILDVSLLCDSRFPEKTIIDRYMDRQTDRQAGRQPASQTDDTYIHAYIYTYVHTFRERDTQIINSV